MSKLVVDQSKVNIEVYEKLKKLCPFNAFDYNNNQVEINANCKMCKICCKKGPEGVVTYHEETASLIDKSNWRGVCVFVEVDHEGIHPVVFELLGKAFELALKGELVYAILVGNKENTNKYSKQLLNYCDKLYIYEDESYLDYNVELYSKCLIDFVNKVKPSVILYGGTPVGRSFAPRIAAHFKTGLTADCTKLGRKENSDLIQVRPAFGGNIMAQIICTNNRPQMATVRYKIFKKPEPLKKEATIFKESVGKQDLMTTIKLIKKQIKEKTVDISEASIIVCIGRPFKNSEDINKAKELALLLGGVLACTRPLVEEGIMDPKGQIGLSGKIVAPNLIITLGVSGAVQFTAGMNQADLIISINNNPQASIFDIAHYGVVCDVFKALDILIKEIKGEENV